MKKTIFKILVIFLIGIGGGIFANHVLWPYFAERPVYITEKKEITIQENTALKNAIEKVERTVVGIETKTKKEILYGSGLILTSDGLVVTLADLVPKDANVSLFLDGKSIPFLILKRDLNNNLALIEVEKDNLPTVGFAAFEKIKLGERVFLVGATFEETEVKKETNEGIVKYFDKDSIRTNIFERASLSGSPLFNIEGEVLGLNTVDSLGRVISIPVTELKTFAGF